MDISNSVCLWITAVESDHGMYRLSGFSFDDSLGLGGQRSHAYSGRMAILSGNERVVFESSIGAIHINSKGWFWQVEPNLPMISAPFLLTSRLDLRSVFAGDVSLTHVNDGPAPLVEDLPLPLVGDTWIGTVVRGDDGALHLLAFASGSECSRPVRAFCPWWAEGLHDTAGGVFDIALESIQHGSR